MVVGTDRWALCAPTLKSRKCRLIWLDVQQAAREDGRAPSKAKTGADSASKEKIADNWWPGMGRWKLGMSMDDAVLELGDSQFFEVQ